MVQNGVLNSGFEVFNSDFAVPNFDAEVIKSCFVLMKSGFEPFHSGVGLLNPDFVLWKY
jgi:hypothetical protein